MSSKRKCFSFSAVLLGLISLSFICSCGDKSNADVAKRKAIEAAVASYYVDLGDNPKSPIDLVDYGLLKQQDILDHNGNHLVFTPEDGRLEELFMTKECQACRKKVSCASSIGDTCPHCGVVWSREGDKFHYQFQK